MSVREIFCRRTFGAELAAILDALYCIHSAYHSGNTMQEPHRGLFAEPEGTSFFEADQLTRFYYFNSREIDLAMFEDKASGAQAALGWGVTRSCSRTLVREVRAQLADQYHRSSQV